MDTNFEKQVRERAFELWQCEGMVIGRDLEYWVAAESEVKSNLPVQAAPVAATKPKRVRSAKAKK